MKRFIALLFIVVLFLFANSCMTVQIDAKEGSRVNVTQTKPVNVDTTATIPSEAIPAIP